MPADEYQISPRVTVHRGDAVKVEGRRGLFRFVEAYEDGTASVVGPVGRAGEGSHVFAVGRLRSAGRTSRAEVAMDPAARDISERAKSWRKR